MIISATYYLKLHNVYLYIAYLTFYQQMLNWLFEHYKNFKNFIWQIYIAYYPIVIFYASII